MEWWIWAGGALGLFLFSIPVSWWMIKIAPRKAGGAGDWVSDNAKVTTTEFADRKVSISNVRDFNWRTSRDHDVNWSDEIFDLDDLIGMYYIVEYIHKVRALAHTMLTFEFRDGRFLTCSFEVRRQKGQKFHPWTGLWRSFELIQVWGMERDVLWLRTNVRKNETYLFPCATLPHKREGMLLGLLKRCNELAAKPEFYHTLTKSCTTALISEANIVTPGKIPFNLGALAPGYSIKPAMKYEIIQDLGGVERTKQLARIDQLAQNIDSPSDYSAGIRANMREHFQHPS